MESVAVIETALDLGAGRRGVDMGPSAKSERAAQSGSEQSIIPLLVYEDIEAAQRFLVQAFGFEGGVLERDPSGGRVVHGEVSLGGSVIWLHRVTAEHGLASPRSLPAASGGLVVLVEDVDAHYERARREGVTIDAPPADQPYG
ncbi:MAG TPA: VOC family protein, partial [Gaiellaceae bacterium]